MSKQQNPPPDKKTEELILDAARKVFTRKGFAAARMEDIAREAGMNRALLHYYYRSKQKMFDMIFDENLISFFSNFITIISGEGNLEDKIRKLVSTEIDLLLQNQELPLFIVSEIAHNPEMIKTKIKTIPARQFFALFISNMENEIKKGNIKKVEPMHVLMSIISLCVFPFVGKPMMMAVTGLDQKQFEKIMIERKKYIADLIIQSLKK